MLTNKHAKILHKIMCHPITFSDIAKFYGYQNFDEFYDDGYYNGLLNQEFWESIRIGPNEKMLKDTKIISVTPEAVEKLEDRRRRWQKTWIPIAISIAAFIISVIALIKP